MVPGQQVLVVFRGIGGGLEPHLGLFRQLGELRRTHGVLARPVRRVGAAGHVDAEGRLPGGGVGAALGQQLVEPRQLNRVHHLGSGRPKLLDRVVQDRRDALEIVRLGIAVETHGLPQDADPGAAQAVGIQEVGVARRHVPHAAGGEGVLAVVARHDVQQRRHVRHRARHGAQGSRLLGPPGVDAGAAHQAGGGAHAGDAVPGGRPAYGGQPFLPDADGAEVGGNRRAGAARRAAHGALHVVGVPGGAEQRAVGVAGAQFAQGGLGQHDGARFLELLHHPAVPVGVVVLEQHRTQGGGGALDVRLVLDDHRDAVERPGLPGLLVRRVHAVRLLQRRRIHRDDGVDPGTAPVKPLDAVDIHLRQLPRGEATRGIGGVDVGDGGLGQRERVFGFAHGFS